MSGKAWMETLAAVGVVGSVFFVGIELRQANAHARAEAYQALAVATAAAIDNWAHDSAFVALTLKDPASMDSVEWQQYSFKQMGFARLAESVLLQIAQGVLPEDAIERLGYSAWASVLEDPKSGCVWSQIAAWGVGDSFRAFVEDGQDLSAINCSGYSIPWGGDPAVSR